MAKLPPDGMLCHWYVSDGPVAVTLKLAVCPVKTEMLRGCWAIAGAAGGLSVTVAVPNFVLSATLVAVTLTVWREAIEAGAVYRPELEIEPAPLGLIAQDTEVLLLPVTVGVNC